MFSTLICFDHVRGADYEGRDKSDLWHYTLEAGGRDWSDGSARDGRWSGRMDAGGSGLRALCAFVALRYRGRWAPLDLRRQKKSGRLVHLAMVEVSWKSQVAAASFLQLLLGRYSVFDSPCSGRPLVL